MSAATPLLDEEQHNDLWNANQFVAHHGAKLRYVPEWGWLVYDGKRWKIDDAGEATELAKSTATLLLLRGNSVRDKDLVLHAYRTGNIGRLNAMVNLAKSDKRIRASVDDFDKDPWLLNAQNGTIDLHTGTLRDHSPADNITKVVPVNYEPQARSDVWEEFLSRIMGRDDSLTTYVQKAMGYSLTGSTAEKGFFVCYGTGDNGKSTLLEAFLYVLGDYAKVTRPETFMVAGGGDIPNDLAELAGSRYVCAAEPKGGHKLNMSRLKQLTGGDTVKARFLNKEFFQFRPQLKIWLATNNRPDVSENGPAVWRRVKLIPFDVRIPDEEQDKDLPNKLKDDAEAILAYAVEGCLLWQKEGLKEPQAMREAMDEYKADQDSFKIFLDEHCQDCIGQGALSDDVHKRYMQWQEDSKGAVPELSRQLVNRELEQHGHKVKRGTGGKRYVQGLSLKPSTAPDIPY